MRRRRRRLMELNGALLNRPLPKEARLARHLALTPKLVQTARKAPRRTGAVKDSVLRALANAEGPMRAREIHAAAEELAGSPLSWNTVKDCLHKQCQFAMSPIRRVGHGVYDFER